MVNPVNNNLNNTYSPSAVQTSDNTFAGLLDESGSSSKSALDSIFERAAEKYGVSANLLKAIAKAESGFNPNAVSPAGAQGMMQLMPSTSKWLGVTNPFDPEQNIMGGAKCISQHLDTYNGDVTLALAAYNAGSGNVKKYGGVPPFKETQNYIQKVTGYMNGDLSTPSVIKSGNSSKVSTAESGSSSEGLFGGLDILMYTRFFDMMTKSEDEEDNKIL